MKRINLICGLLLAVLMLPMGTIHSAKYVYSVDVDLVSKSQRKKVKVNGTVSDYETKEPLAKATLRVNTGRKEYLTNSEGEFKLKVQVGDTIFVQYGKDYLPIKMPIIDSQEPMNIFLKRWQMPSYPGGEQALKEFFSKKLFYPQRAIYEDIEGTVVIEFVVNRDGSIIDAVIVKGVNKILDKSVINIINQMPKWNPAKLGGKPVRARYIQKFKFQLSQVNFQLPEIQPTL